MRLLGILVTKASTDGVNYTSDELKLPHREPRVRPVTHTATRTKIFSTVTDVTVQFSVKARPVNSVLATHKVA